MLPIGTAESGRQAMLSRVVTSVPAAASARGISPNSNPETFHARGLTATASPAAGGARRLYHDLKEGS